MVPLCIFCPNESGSEEHLWAAWIHRRVKFGPIRTREFGGAELIDNNPERTINTVCHSCNNGWMSRLEEKNIPVLGSMLENKPTAVDIGQQGLLTKWAVKTAMVLDSIKDRHGYEKFYARNECVAMCKSQEIPRSTRIWIGALTESHLGAFGTDFTIVDKERTRIGTGIANTIVVGFFTAQVVTIHTKPEYQDVADVQPKPGDWENLLIQIWPNLHKKLNWPPKAAFTNGGAIGIALLMDRWRMGQKVARVTKDGFVE